MARAKAVFLACLVAAVFAGCAGNQAFRRGSEAAQQGDWDAAVRQYGEAQKEDPGNKDYKLEYRRSRFEAAKEHLKRGNRDLAEKNYDRAIEEFRLALQLEPTFSNARNALESTVAFKEAERRYQAAQTLLGAGKESEARDELSRAVEINPAHAEANAALRELRRKSLKPVIGQYEINLKSTRPITIKMADTSAREAFRILSKLSGVNFLFDEEVKDRRVTLSLEEVKFEQALDLLTTLANLSKKVLSENTIILYPTTPAKHAQYQDQFIRTFYLSNVDAKKAVNLVRSIIQVKKIFVNEEINAIVVRDDPDVIKLVEKILDANDITDSELLLDVEILEVDRTKLLNLGIELSPASATASIVDSGASSGTGTGTTATGARVSLYTLQHLGTSNVLFSLPSVILNLKKESSGVEILANPKIRVRNRGKAKLHIGEKVPIITSTSNLGVTTETIQYQDVGVKLDVEPWIHHNNEATLKVRLEVSALGPEVRGATTVAYRINTRVTESELRLHDRETQIIGGLISDEERTTVTKIPGLGDIPGLGYLFSSQNRTKVKTDILMSITPYITRNTAIPSKEVTSVYSGKENQASSERPEWANPQSRPAENPMALPRETGPADLPQPQGPGVLPLEAPPAAPPPPRR
jgi:general secretion pathway protein D